MKRKFKGRIVLLFIIAVVIVWIYWPLYYKKNDNAVIRKCALLLKDHSVEYELAIHLLFEAFDDSEYCYDVSIGGRQGLWFRTCDLQQINEGEYFSETELRFIENVIRNKSDPLPIGVIEITKKHGIRMAQIFYPNAAKLVYFPDGDPISQQENNYTVKPIFKADTVVQLQGKWYYYE
ncbi:hypothetical protein [Algivirga pacifica]|uniref:Uncharacterized protein n=1 Tax=Algivirga pacifica TaxID=1162670 RepID=A0ABP9DMG6_9BACT